MLVFLERPQGGEHIANKLPDDIRAIWGGSVTNQRDEMRVSCFASRTGGFLLWVNLHSDVLPVDIRLSLASKMG